MIFSEIMSNFCRLGSTIWLAFLGEPMTFNDFVQNQPDGKPYAHMNFDKQFKWDAKGENF